MSLAEKLASSLQRTDEQPNIELAQKLSEQNDLSSEFLELLSITSNATKALKHDSIKVLYELAALRPEAFGNKLEFVVDLLQTKDNRLLWGALTTLAQIVRTNPSEIYDRIKEISEAAQNGSVIAKDKYFEIMVQLAAHAAFKQEMLIQITDTLASAAVNQLPMYAEQAVPSFSGQNADQAISVLTSRLSELPNEAKKKRLEQAIVKLQTQPNMPLLA